MKSKKKHTNLDFEVVDGIGKYMDDDIQRIIEGKQLELGDRELLLLMNIAFIRIFRKRDAGRKTKEQENKDAIVL